jgi:hypothetical protein
MLTQGSAICASTVEWNLVEGSVMLGTGGTCEGLDFRSPSEGALDRAYMILHGIYDSLLASLNSITTLETRKYVDRGDLRAKPGE